MCEWFYYLLFIFFYIPIFLFIHLIYFALICQHLPLPCVILILLACFYHIFIIHVYACAILGFLYFSPMTSTEIAVCSFLFLYFV